MRRWYSNNDDDDISPRQAEAGAKNDDESLLQTVTRSQLEDLCQQFNLSTDGTKEDLLATLRSYAAEQAARERERRKGLEQRVQEGASLQNSKERYELVGKESDLIVDEDFADEDDEDFVFYYPIKDQDDTRDDAPKPSVKSQNASNPSKKSKPSGTARITNSEVTAPPIPDHVEPNKDGERSVTVYSTADQNDLTGVAAAQPGHAFAGDVLSNAASMSSKSDSQPESWDMMKSNQKGKASSQEVEKAKETVTELVQLLLSMTGAPAFAAAFGPEGDGDEPDSLSDTKDSASSSAFLTPPGEFVGFHPASVPTEVLTPEVSHALRTGRGEVLQDVLRQFELQAIGQDGMAGDDADRGGGHYREVMKVRAFLEGYRRGEVRRVARETATLLLDRLILDGIEGLDATLSTMARSSDDTSDQAGELNDSLLDYLNDAIRQQQSKVDQQRVSLRPASKSSDSSKSIANDPIDDLWNVEDEDGQRVETIDPNDPKVQKAVLDELASSSQSDSKSPSALTATNDEIPATAPEQLLLLLKLLRERIKAEAAFAPDEKGRNLRLLAYCLRVSSSSSLFTDDLQNGGEQERKELIVKEIGNSIERYDSFIELISSSIEYGESTVHQLQPSTGRSHRPLNVPLLKQILKQVEVLRKEQMWKATSAARGGGDSVDFGGTVGGDKDVGDGPRLLP